MPTIQVINGAVIQADALVKLNPGKERAARAAARINGAEDIFLRSGSDTYVASRAVGASITDKPLQKGMAVDFQGLRGEIASLDDDAAWKRQGLQAVIMGVGTVAGAGVAIIGFTGLLVGLSGAGFAALGLGALLMAMGGAIAALGYFGGEEARRWIGSKADLGAIDQLGERVK